MREYKFRAWDGRLKQMLMVTSLLWKEDGLWACCDGQLTPWDKFMLNTAVKPLMQFTGLHDKTGKEIFEGDVFENQSGKGIITWLPEHCCLGAIKVGTDERFVLTSNGTTFNTEVIGNIYENPELLEISPNLPGSGKDLKNEVVNSDR